MSGAISPLFALSSQGGGSTPVLQTKDVSISGEGTLVVTADAGYDGLEQVNVTVSVKFKPVGGMIFYIDSNSTKTYKFYDSSYNEIQNVAVGDTPAFYEEISEGNGKEKYYVYHDDCYTGLWWTYKKNGGFILENISSTSIDIGAGKTNTQIVMSIRDGEYITDHATETSDIYPTLWKTIMNARDAILGGCTDWFCGSKNELEQLRLFMAANGSVVTNYFSSQGIFSSCPKNTTNVVGWGNSQWWDTMARDGTKGLILIRSF